jgi:transcriptional regulator with XRE-family HTH domain
MDDNDTLTLDRLVQSARKNPSYWMQVALLEFLQSLTAMRASKGILSNKELAKLIGVSAPTVSRWLNGNENITVSTMCRLAAALGAAVHIHVADQNDRGRWRPEVGMLIAERASSINKPAAIPADSGSAPLSLPADDLTPTGDFLKHRARRESRAARSVPPERDVDALFRRGLRRGHG